MLLLLLSRFNRVQLCATLWQQPTRLPRPWDSPGKNTGVGCHFLLQCMKVKSESEVALSCLPPRNPMDGSPPGSSIHGFSRQKYWSGMPLPSPGIMMALWQMKEWQATHNCQTETKEEWDTKKKPPILAKPLTTTTTTQWRKMATHASTFAWKIHGWRSLVGYSPWAHRVRHDWETSLSGESWRKSMGPLGKKKEERMLSRL